MAPQAPGLSSSERRQQRRQRRAIRNSITMCRRLDWETNKIEKTWCWWPRRTQDSGWMFGFKSVYWVQERAEVVDKYPERQYNVRIAELDVVGIDYRSYYISNEEYITRVLKGELDGKFRSNTK